MRVVAGDARGPAARRAPPGTDTRPTSDRVREAIVQRPRQPRRRRRRRGARPLRRLGRPRHRGAVPRARRRATFVERDRAALRGRRGRTSTPPGSADRADRGRAATPSRHLDADRGRFDLALLDPPYAFDGWDDLLGAAARRRRASWCESDRPVEPARGLGGR